MPIESDLIRNWIYSYLKYGVVVTQEQRERSKKKFKQYLIDNAEAVDRIDESEAELERTQ